MDGKVASFGSSFVAPSRSPAYPVLSVLDAHRSTLRLGTIPSSTPSVSLEDAISTAEQTLSGTFNSHTPTLEFLALEDGSAALTHVIQIQNDTTGDWFEAFVDAHENKVLSVTDFVSRASVSYITSRFYICCAVRKTDGVSCGLQFRVLPIDEEILTEGFQTLTDPADTTASPDAWNSDGTTTTTTTASVVPPLNFTQSLVLTIYLSQW